jgi:hypothetical protein
MQNLSSGLNALLRGTEVVKHTFYFIGPKMMFGSVSEHFTNLRHEKMQNLRPSLNAQFWDTKVVNHPFYSIGPKMMFASVSEHFETIRQVKDAKLVFLD